VFPQAIGMGATWDKAMVRSMGNVVSTEARAKYNQAQREGNHRIFYGLTFWSPNINIFRDPRWGRGQETYGEDPFLTGKLGVAFVGGVQGEDLNHLRAVATRTRASAIWRRLICPPSGPPLRRAMWLR
jgi:beta-glucosidase